MPRAMLIPTLRYGMVAIWHNGLGFIVQKAIQWGFRVHGVNLGRIASFRRKTEMAAKVKPIVGGTVIGRNVSVELDGNMLIIRADIGAETTTSGSGKSEVVASTNGNVAVPGTDLKLGLNLYRPN